MTLILIILAGLSAFMLGVILGLLKDRRRGVGCRTETARGNKNGQSELLNQDYRYFLSYDGSQQI